MYARVFAPDSERRTASSKFLKRYAFVIKSILSAQQNATKRTKAKLDDFVQKLGTLDWVLTKEMISEGDAANWDVESDRMRELCWAVFASGAETKQSCENIFAWLQELNFA